MTEGVKDGWKKVKFSDFVITNPKISLEKDKEYPFIEMENISPGNRYVSSTRKRMFKGGGSKFMMGNVLFARITPSLENGKIAQVNDTVIKGFGSTEFFVFRHREGISDSSFIYYLSFSERIRKPAKKSMFGASERQRADLKVVQDLWIEVPPLPTQRKIAAILSAYDDLFENNTRRIKILEEMAQTIYKEWFVKFRFLGYEKVKMVDSEVGAIPEEWEVKRLGDVSSIVMGQSPSSKFYNTNGEGLPFHQGVKDFGTRFPTHKTYCTVDKRLAEKGDVLVSVRAPVGRINTANTKIIVGRGLAARRHEGLLQSFLFYQLKNIFAEEDSMGSGSIFNAITKEDMSGIKFLVPNKSLDRKFNELIGSLDKQIEILQSQIVNIRRTRDLLLPRLISGVIDVDNLEIRYER